jgi:DNA-binding MarR family transcriptional regulator
MSELAERLLLSRSGATRLIDRLEASGYVARRPDPADRRAKRVVLTPNGVRLLAEIQKIGEVVNAKIVADIPRSDIARTEDVLRRMKQQLIAMDAVPGAANVVATQRARNGRDA